MKVFSFFSGLGILDLGFYHAGFNICCVNEINEEILKAYKYTRNRLNIFPPEYGYANCDIQDIFTSDRWDSVYQSVRKKDIVGFIGGPPCPDFSFAGKNEGVTGKNGVLTKIYVKFIIEKQPDFFLIENVKGLVQTKKHKGFFEYFKKNLYDNGYYLVQTVDNALEYGVPQYRDRLFLVGLKRSVFGNKPNFQFGYGKTGNLKDIMEMPWPNKSIFAENSYIKKPVGIREDLTVQYWFDKNDVLNHANKSDYFQPKSMKFSTIQEGNTQGKSFKRLHRWRYSPTAAYGNNEVHLHPYQARRISVSEALAIQSLPSNFELPTILPLSVKFKMISNGVPYLMSYNIAQGLYKWINEYLNQGCENVI